ncbi:HET-domain-containing protein, partial [Corynespora cassiicola Philippines]
MLAVVPNGLFSDLKNPHQHYASTFGSVGYILPVAYSSRAPWLTGRPVDPHRINLPLVQTWLQHCKKKHSCTMRYSRPSNLRMIDCKTLDIVAAPPNCNYFALSYVWGAPSAISPAATQDPMVGPGAREVLRRAAPVVRDAIAVVQSLGWRYLWVDKYCIPQSDAALKGEQIGKMDLIYEGAYCTIVAASGSSDRDGLPGISTARTRQPAFSHSGAHFVSSLPDPQSAVRQSTWMTRAWTFQEALCSARRLIFTPQQVYFECKGLHACEAVELPLTLLAGQHARPVLFRDEWVQGARRFGALGAFWAAVREYSGREMTFDSDALAALEGVLRRFQASPAFVYNVFGIP